MRSFKLIVHAILWASAAFEFSRLRHEMPRIRASLSRSPLRACPLCLDRRFCCSRQWTSRGLPRGQQEDFRGSDVLHFDARKRERLFAFAD